MVELSHNEIPLVLLFGPAQRAYLGSDGPSGKPTPGGVWRVHRYPTGRSTSPLLENFEARGP